MSRGSKPLNASVTSWSFELKKVCFLGPSSMIYASGNPDRISNKLSKLAQPAPRATQLGTQLE
jgi:hypothetical protein